MKHMILALIATMATTAHADTYVQGYYRSNGTYVQPHFRSNADNTTLNNYSTRGNVNPYTGSYGTVNPSQNNGFQPSSQQGAWGQYQQQNNMWGK